MESRFGTTEVPLFLPSSTFAPLTMKPFELSRCPFTDYISLMKIAGGRPVIRVRSLVCVYARNHAGLSGQQIGIGSAVEGNREELFPSITNPFCVLSVSTWTASLITVTLFRHLTD